MKNKILTTFVQVFLLVIWIAIQAIAIASLASVLTGIDYKITLFLTAAVTILYTSMGGLKIDILTDFVQFWIILITFLIMAVIGFNYVGGFSNLLANLPTGHLDPFAFGGVAWFLGAVLLSGWMYLGNTSHWQRIFSAKNQETAKKSFLLSIPFVLILSLIVVFLGLVASIKLSGINPDFAFFYLMTDMLPPVLVGVGFASILAVIMSSVDSLVIGGSTILYKTFFKKHQFTNKKEIFFARLITCLFGFGGFLLAFAVPKIITLSLIVSYLALIFVPPVLAGMYSKRISADASFYSILIPTILLFLLYPILDSNTFLVSSPLGILLILFYDRMFKKKRELTPLEMAGLEE
jgi:SSS family solute:Na+ symporter